MKKTYPKSIGELVLRKALYWIPEQFQWTLNECDDSWEIEIVGEGSHEYIPMLDKSINDFILREKLDIETGHLRRSIAVKALKEIEKKLSEA